METCHGNQVLEVDGRELAQLSAGGDTRQCRTVPQPPSLAPSTRNTERVSTNNAEFQKFSVRLSVTVFCAILNGSVLSPQPLPLSPTAPSPAHLPSSPCPLCSSCSTSNASFTSFCLTLSRSKSSPLHSGEAARWVSRRVLRGPSKFPRQQHKGLSQAGLGARSWE